ncbi:LptF/LptG family permease [Candidatus Pelagibacter sp.]|nr:LptF/LptG family permease [Candidatus Pelagibacter sp.]
MKKLLFAHFLKDTLFFFILMSLSLGLIVWVIQAVNYLDFMTEDGHGFYVYFSYTLYNFPKIIHRILPFVFFISLFYQINKYELKNELIIFWTAGVSKFQFIKIILIFSIVFFTFQIILGAYVSPVGQDKARNFIRNSNVDFFPSLFQEGKFIDVLKNLSIFIESEEPDGIFNNIFLKETNKSSNNMSKVIYAKKGSLKNAEGKRYLELFDGNVVNVDDFKTNNFSFDKIDFDLNQYGSKSTSFPKIQELNNKLLIKCLSYNYQGKANELESEIFTCSKNSIKDIKEEVFKRFYNPLYLLLLALIACMIFFISKEGKKFIFYKSIIFLTGFIVIVISEVSLRLASNNIFGLYFFITFPLFAILSLFIFSYYKSKKNS